MPEAAARDPDPVSRKPGANHGPHNQPKDNAKGGAAIMVGALVGIYMLSQFFRNALGVIAPDLSREFDLDAASLGFLSSIFFLSFAAAQIPLGMAMDRWGPKAAILATALVMIISTILFAQAHSFQQLAIARFFMGLGCCSFFMAPLALYAARFSAQKFSTVTGIHLGAGSLGMLAATAPLAWLSIVTGWRNAFLGAAIFAVLMMVCVWLFVQENADAAARRRTDTETLRESFAGVIRAARVRGFWPQFFMQGATASCFVVVLGLWVGPWLAHVYTIPLEQRGLYTLVLAGGQIAGLFVWGASDRWFRSYRRPVALGAILTILALVYAAFLPISLGFLPVFLCFYGFSLGYASVLTAHGKSLFPSDLVGRGLTLLNVGTMGGVFVQQFITGQVINAFGFSLTDGMRIYPPQAYHLVFAVLGAQLMVTLLFYLRVPDSYPASPAAAGDGTPDHQ